MHHQIPAVVQLRHLFPITVSAESMGVLHLCGVFCVLLSFFSSSSKFCRVSVKIHFSHRKLLSNSITGFF